jgi:hypothetical protein
VSRQHLDAEYERSHAHLRDFHARHPQFSHPDVHAAGHRIVTAAQAEDLQQAGLLYPDIFQDVFKRPMNENDIHELHLRARAEGKYGIRSTPQLIEHAARELERRNPKLMRRPTEGR